MALGVVEVTDFNLLLQPFQIVQILIQMIHLEQLKTKSLKLFHVTQSRFVVYYVRTQMVSTLI